MKKESELQAQLIRLRLNAGLSEEQVAASLFKQHSIKYAAIAYWEREHLPEMSVLLCLLDIYHLDDLNPFFGLPPVISPTAIAIGAILDLDQKIPITYSYRKPPVFRLDLERKRRIRENSISEICNQLQLRGIQVNEAEYEDYEQGKLTEDVQTILALCDIFGYVDFNFHFDYRICPRLSEEALAVALMFLETRSSKFGITMDGLLNRLKDEISSYYYFYEVGDSGFIAGILRSLRMEAGLSREDLSIEIGIDTGVVSLWEQGKAIPSLPGLLAYAEAFDVSVDYLLGRAVDRKIEFSYGNRVVD